MRIRFSLVSPHVAAIGALGVGTLFYFARPIDPIAVTWLGDAGLTSLAQAIHDARAFVFAHAHAPRWLRGSASDAAYAFSLGAFVARGPRYVLGAGAVLAVMHELAQGLGLAGGTFDPLDLGVLTAFFALACAIFRPMERNRVASPFSANPRLTGVSMSQHYNVGAEK